MFEKQIKEIRAITDFVPDIAVVLGSGLGNYANNLNIVAKIPYSKISDMPQSTAPTHIGQFILGTVSDKKVVLMQGRLHTYEGYTPKQVVMPIRLMRAMGAKKIIITNAAGGINKNFKVGDLMMITDHISCFIDSPLIGKNDDSIGTRYPDMSNAYDKDIQKQIKNVAYKNNIDLKTGIYCQLKGPQFETSAEIKMLSMFGTDAVGMSTVVETIAAKHCGFDVAAISLITNYACGILDKPLSGDEVSYTAEKSAPVFEKLMNEIIKEL